MSSTYVQTIILDQFRHIPFSGGRSCHCNSSFFYLFYVSLHIALQKKKVYEIRIKTLLDYIKMHLFCLIARSLIHLTLMFTYLFTLHLLLHFCMGLKS